MGRGGEGESVVVSNSVSGARTRQYTGREEGEVEGGSCFFCIMEPRIRVAEMIVCNLNHYSEERKDEYADMQNPASKLGKLL